MSQWRALVKLTPRHGGVFAVLECGHELLLSTPELRQAKKARGHWEGGRANGVWIEPKPKQFACGECAPKPAPALRDVGEERHGV